VGNGDRGLGTADWGLENGGKSSDKSAIKIGSTLAQLRQGAGNKRPAEWPRANWPTERLSICTS